MIAVLKFFSASGSIRVHEYCKACVTYSVDTLSWQACLLLRTWRDVMPAWYFHRNLLRRQKQTDSGSACTFYREWCPAFLFRCGPREMFFAAGRGLRLPRVLGFTPYAHDLSVSILIETYLILRCSLRDQSLSRYRLPHQPHHLWRKGSRVADTELFLWNVKLREETPCWS